MTYTTTHIPSPNASEQRSRKKEVKGLKVKARTAGAVESVKIAQKATKRTKDVPAPHS